MRRRRGTGTIERKNGRFAARLPTAEREILGVCDTPEEAGRLLDGWLAERAEGSIVPLSGTTLREFGEAYLDRRELEGLRAIGTDRSRWATHIATAPFAGWPLKAITRAAVLDWVDALKKKRAAPGHGHARKAKRGKLSRSTIQSTLNLLRCCLADALARHLVDENAADGVRLRMATTKTEEPWTYLTLDEQLAVATCAAIPEAEREILRFAFGSGLRQGELWNLELRDLHVADDEPEPRVFVRFGSKGKPPKNGKTRTVPLFGVALDAVRRWLELLPTYATKLDRRAKARAPHNPERLVFPTTTGTRRQKSKPAGGQYVGSDGRTLYRFHDWMRAAVGREVRWHDLRHTCASALVSGMWGRRWSQEEVRDLLGHSSVKVTERYAHLAPSALTAAAAATGLSGASRKPPVRHQPPNAARAALASAWNRSAPPAGIGPATFGLGMRGARERSRVVAGAVSAWCPVARTLPSPRGRPLDPARVRRRRGSHRVGRRDRGAGAPGLCRLAAHHPPRLRPPAHGPVEPEIVHVAPRRRPRGPQPRAPLDASAVRALPAVDALDADAVAVGQVDRDDHGHVLVPGLANQHDVPRAGRAVLGRVPGARVGGDLHDVADGVAHPVRRREDGVRGAGEAPQCAREQTARRLPRERGPVRRRLDPGGHEQLDVPRVRVVEAREREGEVHDRVTVHGVSCGS